MLTDGGGGQGLIGRSDGPGLTGCRPGTLPVGLPTTPSLPRGYDRVAVVIPAHDEQQLLPDCLRSLGRAAAVARGTWSRLVVDAVVVLDDCRDGTAAVAAAAGIRTIATAARNVGTARAVGARALLTEALAGHWSPARTWLAGTDADTRVGPEWLVRQLGFAADGAELVVGTVRVTDFSMWPDGTGAAFDRAYRGDPDAEHPHVHGANLGINGGLYLRLGGYPPVRVGEDHRLVAAAVAAGVRVLRTRQVPVVTSARPDGRASGGFSSRLAELAELTGASRCSS